MTMLSLVWPVAGIVGGATMPVMFFMMFQEDGPWKNRIEWACTFVMSVCLGSCLLAIVLDILSRWLHL